MYLLVANFSKCRYYAKNTLLQGSGCSAHTDTGGLGGIVSDSTRKTKANIKNKEDLVEMDTAAKLNPQKLVFIENTIFSPNRACTDGVLTALP